MNSTNFDVLNCSREDLEKLSDSELESLLKFTQDKSNEYHILQISLKTLINSLYGALGNKAFILINEKIAQAITGNGRYFIKSFGRRIENHLQSLKNWNRPYYIYSDTDSCVGDTLISTSLGKIKIEDLFERPGEIVKNENGSFVKRLDEKILAKSMNSNFEIQDKKIIYVMKHKVNKRMFKISVNNKSVIITEDHSVMINRNDNLISVKPTEILETDELISNNLKDKVITDNYRVEDLGIQELDVYDIEVEDNHNFFGNDILLHNSAYYTIEPFVEEFLKKKPDASLSEIVDFCDKFETEVVQPKIQENIDEFCYYLNAMDKSKCGGKREIIADRFLLLKKKKYLCRLRANEATVFPVDAPKIKAMGVELIKSSTPKFSIEHMSDALPILFDGTQKDLREWFEKCKTEFINAPVSDIVSNMTVNCIDYDLRKDLGIPLNSRASLIYNEFIKKHNLEGSFNLIQAGDKIKYIYLKTPNTLGETIKNTTGRTVKSSYPDVIAFTDDNFIQYFKDYIDYDTQFEKSFIKPLEFMTNAINFTVKEKAMDLFDF